VALASAGLALLLAGFTALAHVPLRQNPEIAAYVAFDATIVLYLTVALTMLQRRRALGALLALLMANGALGASCGKTMVLGEPGLFADVLLVPDLLCVTDPVLAWIAVATVLLDRGELVSLGRLPTYLIPYAVVDRLMRGNVDGAWDGPWRLRPFRDLAILVERDGPGEIICSVQEPMDDCRKSARQAWAWQVDLFDLIDETRPGDDAS
jgi:hypothetical protein